MKNLANSIVTVLAFVALVLGLIAMATPMPGATAFAAASLALLVGVGPRAKRCLRILRTKWSWMDRGVFWIEHKVGTRIQFVGDALIQTRPILNEEAPREVK